MPTLNHLANMAMVNSALNAHVRKLQEENKRLKNLAKQIENSRAVNTLIGMKRKR